MGLKLTRGLRCGRAASRAASASPVLARQAPRAPHHAAEPGHLGVRDVRPAARPAAHLPPRTDFKARKRKAAAAERRRKRKAVRERQAAQAQAGRRRPARTRPGAEAGRQERKPRRGAAPGDSHEPGTCGRPRLPEIRLRRLLAGHGRVPAPARGRVTCT